MRQVLPLLVLIVGFALGSLASVVMDEATVRPLTLTVSPRVGFAPLDLTLLVRLQPDDADRWLRVELDDQSRVSEWSLNGAQSQTLWRVEWKRVLGGDYDVFAVTGDQAGAVRKTTRDRVLVAER